MPLPRSFPRHAHDPAANLNVSPHTTFAEVLAQRLSRRQVLGGGAALALSTLAGCNDEDILRLESSGAATPAPRPATPGASEQRDGGGTSSPMAQGEPGDDAGGGTPPPDAATSPSDAGQTETVTDGAAPEAPSGVRLTFAPVPKSLQDFVLVPEGYVAFVLTAVGDPIDESTSEYANDGSDGDFARRIGDHGDALVYFPFPRGSGSSSEGLLVQNHESVSEAYIHASGPSGGVSGPRSVFEVEKEQHAHGISLVKIVRDQAGRWSVDRSFEGNARWHANTELSLAGPAAGSAQLVTRLSPGSDRAYGTLNNCGNGYTPWGTYLSGEENWAAYFRRGADAGDPVRDEKLARYGIAPNNVDDVTGRAPFNYRAWDRVEDGDDLALRFDCTASGETPAEDFRNEPNHFGYVVEVDPYRPRDIGRKRTALGRFAHEGAWVAPAVPGEPITVYMGDDSRNEYVYKFVSREPWDPADAELGLAAGDKYLDDGTLYAARFLPDGTGEWLPLDLQNPALAAFEDLADVVVHARLAADAAGATPMDRPEWGGVSPLTREFYVSLTNNTGRGGASAPIDAANPRASNANGHVLRVREAGDRSAATTFTWDIYLFGAPANAGPNVNVSGLDNDNDFSSPDGLRFDARGVLWLQTDDGAYTSVSNCMMLAALPGRVGDGGPRNIGGQPTFVGRLASADNLRRFLVGVPGCEITGVDLTPDHRSLFVGIQHPGEFGSSTRFQSNWPAASGADARLRGAAGNRPRSATIVVTRLDGGEIAT